MKRTYTANVDGQVFHIDEDAFDLLQNYLQKLKITFTGDEGTEIVTDIESRIREHFNERIAAGAGVIVLADVETVIETMGRPEDLSETPEEDKGDKHHESAEGEAPFITVNFPSGKKLYRDVRNKVFGGVIGGVAAYLGWNANIMRLLYVILTFAMAPLIKMWPFIIVYLVAWMIIPPARTPRQILQMKGRPVNVDNVGRAVMEDAEVVPPPYSEQRGFFSSFFSILGKCITGVIGGLSSLLALGSAVIFLGMCAAMIAFAAGASIPSFIGPGFISEFSVVWALLAAITACSLLGIIIFTLIAWGAFALMFNTAGPTKAIIVTLAIVTAMLIIAAVALFAIAA